MGHPEASGHLVYDLIEGAEGCSRLKMMPTEDLAVMVTHVYGARGVCWVSVASLLNTHLT